MPRLPPLVCYHRPRLRAARSSSARQGQVCIVSHAAGRDGRSRRRSPQTRSCRHPPGLLGAHVVVTRPGSLPNRLSAMASAPSRISVPIHTTPGLPTCHPLSGTRSVLGRTHPFFPNRPSAGGPLSEPAPCFRKIKYHTSTKTLLHPHL